MLYQLPYNNVKIDDCRRKGGIESELCSRHGICESRGPLGKADHVGDSSTHVCHETTLPLVAHQVYRFAACTELETH